MFLPDAERYRDEYQKGLVFPSGKHLMVMSVAVNLGEKSYRLSLLGAGKDGPFIGNKKIQNGSVIVWLNSAEQTYWGRVSMKVGDIMIWEGVSLQREVGAEQFVELLAPEISTFPGQPKVWQNSFEMKLRIVTLPHKSRAKVR